MSDINLKLPPKCSFWVSLSADLKILVKYNKANSVEILFLYGILIGNSVSIFEGFVIKTDHTFQGNVVGFVTTELVTQGIR